MEYEPTLLDAITYQAVNVSLGICHAIVLFGPIVFWVMTP